MIKQGTKLEAICRQFILDMNISCPEVIHQTDRVIENAYEFIERICNELGYVDENGNLKALND